MSEAARVDWKENGLTHSALWLSDAGVAPPGRVVIADDRINADTAYRQACEGTALLWRGDFQNARQLLPALARRTDAPKRKAPTAGEPGPPAQAFHRYRMAKAQRARTLGMLLIPFDAGHVIPLKRAPDVAKACTEARGPAAERYIASLRELLGIISAYEWRRKGVEIPALGARIHPHYGVFSPVRGEYIDLLTRVKLPSHDLAFDIGTGTGVLAALLAKRGMRRVIATENVARALACARDNVGRLGMAARVDVREADLYPEGRAGLVVCNPPWLPGRASTSLEHAVYDPDSRMLRGFLARLAEHLLPGGEGWLILSDLAEHLGLRTRDELLAAIANAGLAVIERLDTRPTHRKAFDAGDPLAAARGREVTSLWRLQAV